MSKNIYVGNLPYGAQDSDLQELFSRYGQIESAKVIIDRESGKSRGFGFVVMTNNEEADKAIAELNGHALEGRNLVVNEARPKEARPREFGGGGGGGFSRPRNDRRGGRH